MAITNHKITLLLGAGFAIHMKCPGTDDINQLFAEDVTYVNNYEGKSVSMFNYVKTLLSDYFFDFSFETFLAVLEQILDYQIGIEYSGKVSIQDRILSSVLFVPRDILRESLLLSKSAKELWGIYKHYVNTIIDAIARKDSIEDCQEDARIIKEYIVSLKEKYDQIKIYSTNYDSLCSQILSDEGLYISTDDSFPDSIERAFVYDLNEFRERPLTYFPLHGSIYFKRESFNCIKYCSYKQPLSDIAFDNNAGNPNGYTFFSPIISGYNKLQHINGKPFIMGAQEFANDLQDSDIVLTLGYSFRDPHINSYIGTFSKGIIQSVTKDPVIWEPLDWTMEKITMDISSFLGH